MVRELTINVDAEMSEIADGNTVRCVPVELRFNGRAVIMTFIVEDKVETMTYQYPEDMMNAALMAADMMASFSFHGFVLDDSFLDRHRHVAALFAIGLMYPKKDMDQAEKFIIQDLEIDETALKLALVGVNNIAEEIKGLR